MNDRPSIGVSQCLLGEKVRYDGGHKRLDWLVDELGKHVDFQHVCPELEMGLGVPRPTMRLEYDPTSSGQIKEKRRLISSAEKNKESIDHTELAESTSQRLLKALNLSVQEDDFLSGFILTKNSPSCGVEGIKVYNQKSGAADEKYMGFFAEALTRKFPLLPVIDSGRLHNIDERENFMKKVIAYHRFHRDVHNMKKLQKFHEHYKYIIMGHGQKKLQSLESIAAHSVKGDEDKLLERYREIFFSLLKELPPTKESR